MPSKKRDKLFHELNERASKGIIAEKFSPKLFKSESNEEELSQKAFGKNQTRESILLDGKMKEMQMSKTLAKT